MEVPACPGCRARDDRSAVLQRRIAELEARLRDLEARLGTNAANSSLPPSANPPHAPKPVVKKKSKRQPGAQPGHPPHLKQLLPPERVAQVQVFVPQTCERCHAPLPQQAGPGDPEPKRHQVIDIPDLAAFAIEYQAHARTCRCGHVTCAVIPADVRAQSVGERLASVLMYYAAAFGLSKRAIEEIAAAVHGAPLALGSVIGLQHEVSAALEPAHAEALAAVRQAEIKAADETGWKLRGLKRWLWAAATVGVAAFVIHASRGAAGLAALLGEQIDGILHSDRWRVYHCVPPERRQICWAHLKRDFQKIVDRGGPSAALGRRGLRLVKRVFAAWHGFREGRVTRAQLRQQMKPLIFQVNKVLIDGALGGDAQVARFCENVLALEDALWLFVERDGVEPTNNLMERLLRPAVLWRKRSFGCTSEAGCRFVERSLTVVQTRRLQGKSVLEFFHDALRAYRNGQPCPSLLSNG